MPFGHSEPCDCLECGTAFPHAKKLSEHLKKAHRLSSVDYVVKHHHDGKRPMCLHCGQETRFVSLTAGFKRYCASDRKIAESAAGREGGKLKATWNRGKTNSTDDRVAALSLKRTGEGNPFFGRHHTTESLERMAVTKRLSHDELRRRAAVCGAELKSGYGAYEDQNSLLTIACLKCGTEDGASLFNLQRCWRCRTCMPAGSRQQQEIADYVRSLGFQGVVTSTRDVIPPLELDVWVPSRNVAIEYHGLYWHSGGKDGTFDKGRHRQKYLACKAKDIRLIQLFSDEWLDRGDVCRSMIAHALGASSVRLNARDCTVELISQKESAAFVGKNHVSGSTRARHHVGLVHGRLGLVGAATTRTPVQRKHGHVCELARMCFLADTSVRGGASRLLARVKDLARSDGFDGVLSYAELRYGDGGVYERCGFSLVGEALNNYWYTDGCVRYDRFKFRAQPGLPEKAVAEANGVRPVWGCGNRVYLCKF